MSDATDRTAPQYQWRRFVRHHWKIVLPAFLLIIIGWWVVYNYTGLVPWLIARKAQAAIERCDGRTLCAMADPEEVQKFHLTPEALTTVCYEVLGTPGTFRTQWLAFERWRKKSYEIYTASIAVIETKSGRDRFIQTLPDGQRLPLSISIDVVRTRHGWRLLAGSPLDSFLFNTALAEPDHYWQYRLLMRRLGITGLRRTNGEVLHP